MKSALTISLKKHLDSIIEDKLTVNDVLSKLSDAFYSCDVEIFQKVLDLGMDPNLPLCGNHTPLTYLMSYATSGHWTEIAKLLITKGASTNVNDPHGVPIIYSFISSGEADLMSMCLDYGVHIYHEGGSQREPLIIAAVHYRQLACLRYLLSRGADPNVPDKDGNTAVMWAAGRSNGIGMQISLTCLKTLIDYGADVNIRNKAGFSPLMAASLINEVEAVKVLLEAGSDVDVTDKKGETALFKAVDSNAAQIVKMLLQRKADVNVANSHGFTPSMRSTSLDVLELLVLAEADLSKKDETGRTVLHHKAEEGNLEMVKLLVDFGASIEDRNSKGETSLQLSVRRRSYSCASFLLEVGSSCCSSNEDNVGVIHDALLPWDYFSVSDIFVGLSTPSLWRELIFYTSDYRPYAHRLLERIAHATENPNMRTFKGGVTPLMIASGCGNLWAAKYLISFGASPLAMDSGGRSALSYAARSGNTELVSFLVYSGCDPNSEDNQGNLPIFYAASFNNEDIVRSLLVEFAFYYCSTVRSNSAMDEIFVPLK